MKKTNILIRSISFLLSFLLIFTLPHTSMHGANDEMSADDSYEIMPLSVISWSSMKSISTTNVKYYKISDMTSCGENLTNDATKDIKYDSLMRSDTTRLTYQKKLPISQGTKVNLLATKSDTGKGGANLTDDEKVYWNVLEFDKNGYCLYDSGWLDMEDTWTAGKTTGGTSMNTSKKRSTVKYLIFLFRFAHTVCSTFSRMGAKRCSGLSYRGCWRGICRRVWHIAGRAVRWRISRWAS